MRRAHRLARAQLRRLLTPKRQLSVFSPRRPRIDSPNYFPLSTLRMLERWGSPWLVASDAPARGGARHSCAETEQDKGALT